MKAKMFGFLSAIVMAGCAGQNVPTTQRSDTTVPAACAAVIAVAETRTDLSRAQEVRVGYWPAEFVCQMLVVNERSGRSAQVTYVWYGLPGHRGSQVPGRWEIVNYTARVAANGDITFRTHWGAEVTYSEDGTTQNFTRSGLTLVGFAPRR